jgi:hypothetical protein
MSRHGCYKNAIKGMENELTINEKLISELRNKLTPVKQYFALIKKCDEEHSLIAQDKLYDAIESEKGKVFDLLPRIWQIIDELK